MNKIAAYELLIEAHPLWTKEAGNALRLGKKKTARVMAALVKRSKSVKEIREAMPTAARNVVGHEKIVRNLAELPREVGRIGKKIENKVGANENMNYVFSQLAKGTKHPSFKGKVKMGPDWNRRPSKY